MYISIVLWHWFVALDTSLCAGFFEILLGSVNTRKHPARFFLQVSDGLNSISLLFSFTASFWVFLDGVSDRFLCRLSLKSGFSLGVIVFSLARASLVHSCGVKQFLLQSLRQSWHLQKIVCWWVFLPSCVLKCADTLIRPAMVFVPCLWIRHLVGLLLRVHSSELRWNQVGSWFFRCVLSLIVVKLTLYFCAALSILVVSSSSFAARAPLCGGFQFCRKVFILVWAFGPRGIVASIMRLMILAHVGCIGEKSRYVLSHVIFTASFLARRSIRLRLPSLIGHCRVSRAILFLVLLSQRKSLVILVSVSSTSVGIPCAFIKNCVWPPIIAWAISFCSSKVRLDLPLCFSTLWTLLNIGFHGVLRFVLFPIQAPSDLTTSVTIFLI